jgi:predicted RND superfamily exporter protein
MGRALAVATLLLVVFAAVLVRPVVKTFKVDASTESLVLEDDPDARRYDRTGLLFGTDEFVLVGLTRDDLFTPEGVAAVASLHAELAAIPGVQDVLSLASAKLYRSFSRPIGPAMALLRNATIRSPGIDLAKAREELTHHELYAGNIVSKDGRTAGLVVTLQATEESVAATRTWVERQAEVAAAEAAVPSASATGDSSVRTRARREAEARLASARAAREAFRPAYTAAEDARKAKRIEIVRAVRQVVAEHRARGEDIGVSGVPSIVVEMVEAIDRDLRTFSLLSLAFIVLFLGLVFRRVQWVVLPLIPTLATVVLTLWLMDVTGKHVTVITGNIPSLLLVMGIAHSIHVIVRWREDLARYADSGREARALRVVRSLVWPCLFTATTTMVGFFSLFSTGSRPILDFALFMAIGIGLAFALSFVALPGALSVLPVKAEGRLERSAVVLERLVRACLRRRGVVVALALALAVFGGLGIARLGVEARFVDYFSPRSPIHEGLTYIDEHLGGTSGLEVVISGPPGAFGPAHPENLEKAAEVARWLQADDREGVVGVVLGYTGFLDELRKLNPRLDRQKAAMFLMQLLDRGAVDPALIDDYVVTRPIEVEGKTVAPFSTVRIVARVRDTAKDLRRLPLLHALRAHLAAEFPPGEQGGGELHAEATGMFVLYANMLQSLVQSQVSSTIYCVLAIFAMLALLHRSLLAAALALIPNVLPIGLVLGTMGWLSIPLDMATVMIASISMGIGIDCAIHYLFCYEGELRRDGDVEAALVRTSGSIGTSILYTSLTSVVGFAVLAFSEFRPNAYFGAFTGLAMVTALFAMLTLLPVLVRATGLFRRRAAPPAAPAP